MRVSDFILLKYIQKQGSVNNIKMQKTIIRLRVKTNKQINLMVAIENEKTIRELAHRVLICFHQLAEQHVQAPPKRRELTITGIKVDNFFISKDQIVGNLLKDNDQIQCMLSKTKPKFPQASRAYENSMKDFNRNKEHGEKLGDCKWKNIEQAKQKDMIKERTKEKKQKKREKIQQKKKQLESQQNKIRLFQELRKTNQNFLIPQIQEPLQKEPLVQKQFKTYQIYIPNKNGNGHQQASDKIEKINPQRPINCIEEKEKQQKNSNEAQPNQNISLDTTLTISHRGQIEQNETVETKKDILLGKKSLTTTSILDILSKAADEKGKRNKKKEKKGVLEDKSQSKNQTGTILIFPKNSKPQKQKQAPSINKIASPKVTFHNSPLLSPQALNINSPKRKASNPSLEKIELETFSEITNEKKGKKFEKQTPEVKTIESVKKKGEFSSKIIVEEDSDAQSGGLAERVLVEKPKELHEWNNSKVTALNEKINKYKLQFFNESSGDQ